MVVLSVWAPKGGVGKTTLSINLAAAAVDAGLRPLVVCLDPQGSALLFGREGHLPFDVVAGLPAARPAADVVLIDHVAADWQAPQARVVVLPTRPSRDAYRAYLDARSVAERAGKAVLAVCMDYQQRRPQEAAVARRIGLGVPSSGAFSRAAAEFRTVFDPALDRVYGIGARRQEFRRILAAAMEMET